MSMLKKTLIYLGLGPDEEYDAFDEYAPNPEGVEPVAAAPRPNMRAVAEPSAAQAAAPRPSSTVRPIRTTYCGSWAWRHLRVTSLMKCRTCTGCRV